MSKTEITIGIITQEHRTPGLRKLLHHLKPVIERHSGSIELIIANNSGAAANSKISESISASEIPRYCPITLIDSPQNNIATGRNILLNASRYRLIAFLDDDEYPCADWLIHLVAIMKKCNAAVVAGPVPVIFHASAPRWVHHVDLHNVNGRSNAHPIENTGTGNVLLNMQVIGELRFDEKFGKSGGSDTDFFLRVRANGGVIYWASEAIAYEDIPESRSTASYLIHRFIKQGENYRKINHERGLIHNNKLFTLRAVTTVLLSMPIAGFLILIRHPKAGNWMKRAFSNYGKLHSPSKDLYEN